MYGVKLTGFFLLTVLCTSPILAQLEDTTDVDNDSLIKNDVQLVDTTHSPRKAALFSLILPGAGQVYNHMAMPKGEKKAFWKVPLIYAGLGVTGYFAIQNHIEQKALKDEYTFRVQNGSTNLPQYEQFDNQGILTLYEQKQRSRDLMILAFIVVHGLNILDAHVEAHFTEFDVSPDLSLRLSPRMHDFQTPGLSLSFNFR